VRMALWWALASATARLRGYVSARGAARRCRDERLPRVPQGHFSIWSVCIALMWALRARAGPTLSFYLKLAVGHLRLYVCLCIPPMGRPRSGFAHGLHWQTNGLRDGPDFQRISTTSILGTCMHARIKSIHIGERRSARPSNCSPDLQ